MPTYQSPALAAQTAGGGDVIAIVGVVEPSDASGLGVTRVVVTPPASYSTVTGVVTNNATINVRQTRAGSVVGTFATVTLASGTNLVAETPLAVPITAPPTLQQDDIIEVVLHQNASGIALGAGLVVDVAVN